MSTPLAGPKLQAFFVYNPTISHKEEKAHENTLYFWPPSTDLNVQMNEVGLCTALNALQERFLTKKEADKVTSLPRSITTGKKRYCMRQFEPDFYFVAVTERGYRVAATKEDLNLEFADEDDDDAGMARNDGDSGDSSSYMLPYSKDDSDATIETIVDTYLTIHYRMFVMLCGQLQINLDRFKAEGKDSAALKMKRLLGRNLARLLVPTLSTSLNVTYNYQVGSFATPAGVEYVAPSDEAYLVVSSLLARIQSVVPTIKHTAVSHQGKVLFSSLSLEDTFTLFQLIPALFDQRSLSAGADGGAATNPPPVTAGGGGASDSASPTFNEHIRREEALRSSLASGTASARRGGAPGIRPASGGGAKAGAGGGADFASDTGRIGFVEELKEMASSSNGSAFMDETRVIPSLVINGQVMGLLSCPVRSMRFLLLLDYDFVSDPNRCMQAMKAIQAVITVDGERLVRTVITPSLRSSAKLDESYVYFYANRTNLAVKSSILNRKAASTVGSRDQELAAIHTMDLIRHAMLDWKLTYQDGRKGRKSEYAPEGVNPFDGTLGGTVCTSLTSSGKQENAPFSAIDERVSCWMRVRDSIWLSCVQAGDREFYVAVEGATLKLAQQQAAFVERAVFFENFAW